MLTRAQIIQILEGELNLIEGRGTDDEAQLLKHLFEGHGADDNAQLRQALKDLIEDTDDDAQLYQAVRLLIEGHGTDDDAQLHQALNILVVGLKALEGGEVQPLFAPKKVKARGKRPVTVTEQRYIAVGAVRALANAGCGVEEAIETVAQAYGRSPEAIDHWRKTLGKDTDSEAQGLMALLPSNYTLFAFTKEDLLSAIKRAGQAFKDAQEKKGK